MVCYRGHKYYKTKECPACPQCVIDRVAKKNFLSSLPAPARRSLENAGIRTPRMLSLKRKSELLALHGVSKTVIPKLKRILNRYDLEFREEKD